MKTIKHHHKIMIALNRIFKQKQGYNHQALAQFSTAKTLHDNELKKNNKKSKVLFVKSNFGHKRYSATVSKIALMSPAIIYASHYTLTNVWTPGTLFFQLILLTGGWYFNKLNKIYEAKSVQAVQISQDSKLLYFSLNRNSISEKIFSKSSLKCSKLTKSSTYQDINGLSCIYMPKEMNEQGQSRSNQEIFSCHQYLEHLQRLYIRIQVPINLIKKVSYYMSAQNEAQLTDDKVSLSFDKFCQKYSNKQILVELDMPEFIVDQKRWGNNITFSLNSNNARQNNRYFDKLIYKNHADLESSKQQGKKHAKKQNQTLQEIH